MAQQTAMQGALNDERLDTDEKDVTIAMALLCKEQLFQRTGELGGTFTDAQVAEAVDVFRACAAWFGRQLDLSDDDAASAIRELIAKGWALPCLSRPARSFEIGFQLLDPTGTVMADVEPGGST
jgi:hypothetical protein